MIQLIKHNRINYGAKRGERSLLLFAREGAMIIFVYVNILSWKWHGKSANSTEAEMVSLKFAGSLSIALCKSLSSSAKRWAWDDPPQMCGLDN